MRTVLCGGWAGWDHLGCILLKARCGPPPLSCSIYLQNDADSNVSEQPTFLVVVAIDFGTTSSGYAYSFTKEPECIHVMR